MSSFYCGMMQMTDAAIISHTVIISYRFCKGRKRFVLSVRQFCPLTNETITCRTKAWNGSTAQTRLALHLSRDKRDLCCLTQSCNDTTVIVLVISYFPNCYIRMSDSFIDILTAYKLYCRPIRWTFLIGLLLVRCPGHVNPTASAEQ